MTRKPEAYLFGMVLGTHSFLLKDGFLLPDEYSEIGEHYFLPGGETGTAATVLDSLGVAVRMDGTWIGTEVAPMLVSFYADKKVDLSPLRMMENDPGVMDYVVIAGLVRSPMGRFQTLFSTGERWWSIPKEEDIAGCSVAAIDPFFREESIRAAEICGRHGDVFRYGGEEFAVIFRCDLELAEKIMQNALEQFSAMQFEFMDSPVTFSYGSAQYDRTENSVTLFDRADQVMYTRKRAFHAREKASAT